MMDKTIEFLTKRTFVLYLSTIKDGKPSCRPFGAPVLFEGGLYSMTHAQKDVVKQIAADNHVCIVALDGDEWIRIDCEMLDDSGNKAAKQACIDMFDWAEAAGYTLDAPDFVLYRIANATATIYNEEGEALATEQF